MDPSATPDLAALVAHYQRELRLLDWRIDVAYEPNLVDSKGRTVWGLCLPVADSKTARIIIRDPATPPDGVTPEQAVREVVETVVHELCHLHFAPFANRTPEAIVAEEQAVWALAEALVAARGTPAEQVYARVIVARAEEIHARLAAPNAERSMAASGMSLDELVKAAKALGFDGSSSVEEVMAKMKGEAPAEDATDAPADAPADGAPPMAAAAPKPDEPKPAEMQAAARLVLAVSGKSTLGEGLAELSRCRTVVLDLEAREAKLKADTALLESGERTRLVGALVKCGAETPAFAWAPDAAGLPDGKTPAPEYAAMPLERLRAKVAERSKTTTIVAAPKPPVSGGAGDLGLTAAEVAKCKARGVDPAKLAETKAAIKARSTNARPTAGEG